MNGRRDPDADVTEVVRLLAPLAGARAEIPSSDAVYWRAQARLTIEEARRRRRKTLRPLRLFHLAIGVIAIAAAVLVSVSPLVLRVSPGAELVVVPLLFLTASVGAYLLAEAGSPST